MKILGIETSCDETSTAIVEDGRKILSNVVSSSWKMHQKTGGIIPEIAAREQVKCIIPVITDTLLLAKNKNHQVTKIDTTIINRSSSNICRLLSDIDAFAVTIGPGLIGSLLVGVETAKTIAYITQKPIIPVNHIFAHIYANWLIDNKQVRLNDRHNKVINTPLFPAIALVASGGHTELFLLKNHKDLKWLGGTRDDAAGEAFDKTARLLGLEYPGGPAIAAEAAKCKIPNTNLKFKINLPRPMMYEDNLDFSFSGLKTAVIREINKLKSKQRWNNEIVRHLAYEIQEAITDVLVTKTIMAVNKFKAKSILLGGGVAANQRLSDKFNLKIKNSKLKINLYIPPPSFCTDNAAYIASYAYFHYQPMPWHKIQAKPNLEVEV